MKPLPIGVSNFDEMIIGGYYFVDKTLLIKDVLLLAGKVKLITRPRRFGKTLNLNMIKEFYSIKGKDLFEGLRIWNEKNFLKDHYHKYPVLYVSFKDIKDPCWECAKDSLEEMLSKIAISVLSDLDIEDEVIKWIKKRYLGAEIKSHQKTLLNLTEALYRYHRKKVILLIDEYDVPIEAAYTYRHKDPEYYENMVAFMRNLLTAALKDNPYLEFAILTGVYRVAKESIFSGLNNVAVYTIFENAMSDKFGFTEEEVYELLKHYDLAEDMKAVMKWYNGYTFGKTEGIYNPWSIIYYLKERLEGKSVEQALQPYWINTSSNDIIIKQIESNPFLQEKMDKLLSGDELIVPIDPHLSLREIEQNPSGVWTLLAHAGYLNAVWVAPKEYKVFIPNEEVRLFYKERVMLWLERKSNVSFYEIYQALKEVLVKGETGKFLRLLERYLSNSLSYFDVGYDDAERVYKAFVLGMLSMATDGYVVETEAESGYGRVDVAVYPRERRFGKYALVMEMKRAESENDLEKAAQSAFDQIREKEYSKKYESLGFDVIPIGIAFYGKRVFVKL